MAIKNQSQVNLTKKGMKDTLVNICHIGFKVDYYYNLELIYGGIVFDDSTGGKTVWDSLILSRQSSIQLQERHSPAFGVSQILLWKNGVYDN